MIRLIADIFSVAVDRKRNAKFTQIHKAAHRQRRLAERGITVNTSAGKKIFCHLCDAVQTVAAQTKLIIPCHKTPSSAYGWTYLAIIPKPP